jgi:hypothetical protein
MDVDEAEGAGSDAAAAAPAAAAPAGAGVVHPPFAVKEPTSPTAAAAAGGAPGPSAAAAAADDDAAAAEAGADVDEAEVDSELLSDPDTVDADEQMEEEAIREIRMYQRSSHMLMSRYAFKQVAEDVLRSVPGG